MDSQTSLNAQTSIQNLNTCQELQAYKKQILALMTAEQNIINQKLLDLASLTNPVTFIANYIKIATRELVTVTQLSEGLVADIEKITSLLQSQAEKINCK